MGTDKYFVAVILLSVFVNQGGCSVLCYNTTYCDNGCCEPGCCQASREQQSSGVNILGIIIGVLVVIVVGITACCVACCCCCANCRKKQDRPGLVFVQANHNIPKTATNTATVENGIATSSQPPVPVVSAMSNGRSPSQPPYNEDPPPYSYIEPNAPSLANNPPSSGPRQARNDSSNGSEYERRYLELSDGDNIYSDVNPVDHVRGTDAPDSYIQPVATSTTQREPLPLPAQMAVNQELLQIPLVYSDVNPNENLQEEHRPSGQGRDASDSYLHPVTNATPQRELPPPTPERKAKKPLITKSNTNDSSPENYIHPVEKPVPKINFKTTDANKDKPENVRSAIPSSPDVDGEGYVLPQSSSTGTDSYIQPVGTSPDEKQQQSSSTGTDSYIQPIGNSPDEKQSQTGPAASIVSDRYINTSKQECVLDLVPTRSNKDGDGSLQSQSKTNNTSDDSYINPIEDVQNGTQRSETVSGRGQDSILPKSTTPPSDSYITPNGSSTTEKSSAATDKTNTIYHSYVNTDGNNHGDHMTLPSSPDKDMENYLIPKTSPNRNDGDSYINPIGSTEDDAVKESPTQNYVNTQESPSSEHQIISIRPDEEQVNTYEHPLQRKGTEHKYEELHHT